MLWCPSHKQVAFADKCLLNKIDLVSADEKREVIDRIKVGRAGRAKPTVTSCHASFSRTNKIALLLARHLRALRWGKVTIT